MISWLVFENKILKSELIVLTSTVSVVTIFPVYVLKSVLIHGCDSTFIIYYNNSCLNLKTHSSALSFLLLRFNNQPSFSLPTSCPAPVSPVWGNTHTHTQSLLNMQQAAVFLISSLSLLLITFSSSTSICLSLDSGSGWRFAATLLCTHSQQSSL